MNTRLYFTMTRSAIFFITVLYVLSCDNQKAVRPYRTGIVEAVYASGRIYSVDEYSAYALTGGVICRKFVEPGNVVKKGDILYQIKANVQSAKADATRTAYLQVEKNLSEASTILEDLKLAIMNAEERLKNDSITYSRLKNLFDRGIGTRNAIDNAYTIFQLSRNNRNSTIQKYYSTRNELEVSLKNAQSEWTKAQEDVQNSMVRSEIDGTVYLMLKENGEVVRANDVLALIGSSDKRIIRLNVDQQDIARISPGQKVLLRSDVTGKTIYNATVHRIYPAMNELDQTFRVDALFTGNVSSDYIRSSVEANIIVSEKKNALVVPASALINNDSVLVKRGRHVERQFVEIGIRNRDIAEILSGILESDQIIIPSKN